MDNETSEVVSTFLAFLRDSKTNYNIAEAREQELNDMTQDILHSLELDDNSYHEAAHLARVLAEVRKERRDAKDLITVLSPLAHWVEDNKTVLKSLERLLGDIRKAEKSTESRFYIPRTDVVKNTLRITADEPVAKVST